MQKIVLGGEGVLGAVPPVGVQWAEPRWTWSINAFCIIPKAYS